MSNPVEKFNIEIHAAMEKIVKAMKKHNCNKFSTELTDLTGNKFSFTVEKK